MSILKDLSVGKNGELLVISELEKLNFKAQLAPPRTKEYDIIVTEPKNLTIEVKNDIYAEKSGNVALEIWNSRSNKPSGLMVSKADIWAHIICGKVYITTLEKLKQFCDDNKPKRVIDRAGDGNATIYLYDVDTFKTICLEIEKINELA